MLCGRIYYFGWGSHLFTFLTEIGAGLAAMPGIIGR
jgi:hypothetical protein